MAPQMVKGSAIILLAAILACSVEAVRVGDASANQRPLFLSAPEPRLHYFNSLASPEAAPAPVSEQPEPENPVTPRLPTELGVQLENVINSLRYRYPDPTTTPRPGSFRASVYVPPGLPSAFSRQPPQPQGSDVPLFTAPDGTLIPGISDIDRAVASNRLQQEQARRDQNDAIQAEVLRRVQQEALEVIRESVSLITTNPGARRRPNTVIRPQQLMQSPGQTQAVFQQQQQQPSFQFLQQFPVAQPQQGFVPSPPTPPTPPTPPSPPEVPQVPQVPQPVPAFPAAPAYPAFPLNQPLYQQQQQQASTLVHAANPPITGVSYSNTYHVSMKRPQIL
ncbi:Hypothetical predicted protein [Cloeon dipterum]|uniref:Uncharacterized protein n=1 Tax=Cloeon dipterum TaxID=197152 RepID=A0A8S1CJT1_9INSE|nr:Hypothetical predicted protein [Cloeon dipterum]